MAGACASNARRWATQAAAAALPVDLLATFADDKNTKIPWFFFLLIAAAAFLAPAAGKQTGIPYVFRRGRGGHACSKQ